MIKHAKLAPSASERWINCPISVHLSEGFEDTTSIYAAEGRLAHKLGELKLRAEFTDNPPTDGEFEAVRANSMYDLEMEEATDEYVERIRAVFKNLNAPDLSTEIKLDMSGIAGGECFGTADCIICSLDELHIFDFKYGRNIEVEADENPQMRLYALGAVNLFDAIYDFKTVTAHIVQPRMNNYSAEELTTEELKGWGKETMEPAAHDAIACKGKPHSGRWCQFCRAKPICREYGKPFENPPGRELPPEISNAEVAERIALLEGVDAYLRELKEYALNATLKGEEIPGFKAVEGKSNRKWKDQDAAFEAAEKAGFDRSILFERKPLSLSKIETLMGKKKFNEIMKDFVEKPKGKPTLVRDNDRRESYRRKSAEEDFKDVLDQMEFD